MFVSIFQYCSKLSDFRYFEFDTEMRIYCFVFIYHRVRSSWVVSQNSRPTGTPEKERRISTRLFWQLFKRCILENQFRGESLANSPVAAGKLACRRANENGSVEIEIPRRVTKMKFCTMKLGNSYISGTVCFHGARKCNIHETCVVI